MNETELRRRLATILAAEEKVAPDWNEVARLTDDLNAQLRNEPDTAIPEDVNHYLDDPDIRARDANYAAQQREHIRQFIETGSYRRPTVVSCWTVLLVGAVVGALLIWFLR